MAEHRPRDDLEYTFEPAELTPSDPHFKMWCKPLKRFTREKALKNEASERFRVTFGKRRVLQEKRLPNGSIMDCVLLEKPGGVPHTLVEYKRPGSGGAEGLDLLTHVHQPLNYASQIMFEHPELSILPIILTDGRFFTAGYGKRGSLGSLVFVLCQTQFTLYAKEKMGPDFGLFWAMCNHSSPKCSLVLAVQDEPKVTVRVSKCIGNGVSSFVYEGSLVEDSAIAGSGDQVYSTLLAAGRFAVKIPKVGQVQAWTTERGAFELFQRKQLHDCCVFPIHWRDTLQSKIAIYPLGVPVVPTVDTKPGAASPLKMEHFAGLLRDLCAIHDAGVVHRDIRLANILIVGDAAKLIDFGYATPPISERPLLGTLVTASQAVLEAALRGRDISYGPKDDLESLLKVFWMHLYDLRIEHEEGEAGIWTVYETWMKLIEYGGTEALSYAGMKAYLEKFFSSQPKAWQVKHIRDRASGDK